jgi:hypothetical protein
MFGIFKAICDFFRGKPATHQDAPQEPEPAEQPKADPAKQDQPALPEPGPEPHAAAPPKLNLAGPALDFVKRSARHEAAHVVLGDAIEEKMDWVNVMGKPGEKYAKTHFDYSPEALQILSEQWDGLANEKKMRRKVIDLAMCFVAGHLIESEQYKDVKTVSQRIEEAGEGIWGTLKKGNTDAHMVAWLLSLIDMKGVKMVHALETTAKKRVDANRLTLEAIEKKLIEQGYIEGDEFKQIRGKA